MVIESLNYYFILKIGNFIMKRIFVLLMGLLPFAMPSYASELEEEVVGYIEFVSYDHAIIRPEQITQEIFENVTFIDTRDAEQFEAGTIPGAINIEWRELPGSLEDLPEGKIVAFCNTGSLSAQAVFAVRLLGADNVVVLQSGKDGWDANAAFKP